MNQKKNKFGNTKTKIGDFVFDSKKEAKRFQELKWLERIGDIDNLVLQPKFKFEINGKPLKTNDKGARQITYTADFQYEMDGETIVEDVKSTFTAKEYVFKIKKALFETLYDQDLRVVV